MRQLFTSRREERARLDGRVEVCVSRFSALSVAGYKPGTYDSVLLLELRFKETHHGGSGGGRA